MSHELSLLLSEMDELLSHPAAYYDLFPQIASVIEDISERSPEAQRASDARKAILVLTRRLNKTMHPDAQRASQSWRRNYLLLKELIKDHEYA